MFYLTDQSQTRKQIKTSMFYVLVWMIDGQVGLEYVMLGFAPNRRL
jgi:hypothetical protein